MLSLMMDMRGYLVMIIVALLIFIGIDILRWIPINLHISRCLIWILDSNEISRMIAWCLIVSLFLLFFHYLVK
jgi:hypothetical protein